MKLFFLWCKVYGFISLDTIYFVLIEYNFLLNWTYCIVEYDYSSLFISVQFSCISQAHDALITGQGHEIKTLIVVLSRFHYEWKNLICCIAS